MHAGRSRPNSAELKEQPGMLHTNVQQALSTYRWPKPNIFSLRFLTPSMKAGMFLVDPMRSSMRSTACKIAIRFQVSVCQRRDRPKVCWDIQYVFGETIPRFLHLRSRNSCLRLFLHWTLYLPQPAGKVLQTSHDCQLRPAACHRGTECALQGAHSIGMLMAEVEHPGCSAAIS